MPNTNTTSFLSDSVGTAAQTVCGTETDTVVFEAYSPPVCDLPYVRLDTNTGLTGNLLFTIVFMVIFAFIRLRGRDLLYNLFSILVNRKKADIVLNEGISSNLICYVLALGLSFSALAGFLSFVIHGSFLTLHSLYYFAGLSLFHILLLMFVRLSGWTFNARSAAYEMAVNIWTYHIVIGLVVSPFVLSLFFVKSFAVIPLVKIVIFAFGLLMIVKNIRWVEILFAHRVSILYMILYLCTLEIMPLLVLYKVVS